MTDHESQRQPVPRDDDGELDTSMAFLTFARDCLLKKLDGLDDEQVRRRLVPSGTTLLGLVRHLTECELFWFDHHLVGGDEDSFPLSPDPEALSTAQIVAEYRAAIAHSDVNLRGVADPSAPMARLVDGAPLSMRWVLTHMTSETARHAGHADILREQIDGVTGR
jgi:hypothetical protein